MYDEKTSITRAPGRSFYAVLIPFPMVCFIVTLLTDLAYVATDSVLWETFSVWLLAVGLVVAGVAVVAGLVDLVRSRRVRGLGRPWPLVLGELVGIGLSFINVLIHSRDGYTAVMPEGLILSALVVVILAAAFAAGRPGFTNRTRGLA